MSDSGNTGIFKWALKYFTCKGSEMCQVNTKRWECTVAQVSYRHVTLGYDKASIFSC